MQIILGFISGILFGNFYRFVFNKFPIKKIRKRGSNNIGEFDKITRLILGIGFFVWGIYFKNFWGFLASGFSFYEFYSGWCGIYALLNRNTCPIKKS